MTKASLGWLRVVRGVPVGIPALRMKGIYYPIVGQMCILGLLMGITVGNHLPMLSGVVGF